MFAEVPAVVLAVYAHPDDPEVSCGGALARWVKAGTACHLVIANAGEKGSFDAGTDPAELATVRAGEARAAAAVVGLRSIELLGIPDGEVENTDELRRTLVAAVRRLRPDVVVAPDPTAVFFEGYVNHHDHRALGWAVLDAVAAMAASPLYFPDAGLAHQVPTTLLSGTLAPDTWVDIGRSLDTKVAALRCHVSQLGEGVELVGDVVAARALEAGQASGVAGIRYAEGFRAVRLVG
ncbi:MAG: PIG-L deacetylase family protein [Acidimicrobiia bacterium]